MASPSNGTRSEKPPAQKVPRPDDHLALARLMKRKHDLLRELGEINQEEARTRRRIKERGEIEPDSLIILSDDAIQAVIKFLSVADLSKFEVCVRLRCLITPRWDKLLADAEKRIGVSRPAFENRRTTARGSNAYSNKLSLMYLLRSVDRAVDIEKRTWAGELFDTSPYDAWQKCDHIFVRFSHRTESSDESSYRVAWQGFVHVSSDWKNGGWTDDGYPRGLTLTLPEEASLYELHPLAKALKEPFKAIKREDTTESWSEWEERKNAAFTEMNDKAVISIVATRIDQGPENFGTIVSEVVTSSGKRGEKHLSTIHRHFLLWVISSIRGASLDIALCCDENTIRLV